MLIKKLFFFFGLLFSINAFSQSGSNSSLANLATTIGAQRIVECAFESSYVDVKTQVTSEDTKKIKTVANITFKTYVELMKNYPNRQEIEVISTNYPKLNKHSTVDAKLMTMARCSADERVKPLLQAIGRK
jgi:hypothetical protein